MSNTIQHHLLRHKNDRSALVRQKIFLSKHVFMKRTCYGKKICNIRSVIYVTGSFLKSRRETQFYSFWLQIRNLIIITPSVIKFYAFERQFTKFLYSNFAQVT